MSEYLENHSTTRPHYFVQIWRYRLSLCKIITISISNATCQKISAKARVPRWVHCSALYGKSAQRAESESLPQRVDGDASRLAAETSGEPEQIKADPPRAARHARLGDGPRSGRAEHRGRARRDPFGQKRLCRGYAVARTDGSEAVRRFPAQ